VEPGDIVSAVLVVISPVLVKFLIKNETTNEMLSVLDVSPPISQPPLKVSGATAQWVMERSTDPDTGVLQEMPSHDFVDFSCCGAVSAYHSGGPGWDRTLMGGRRITLRKSTDNGRRSLPVSRPNSVIPTNQQEPRDFETRYVPDEAAISP
jgi:hypothetical protein